MLAYCKSAILLACYWLSGLVPRSKKVWLFGNSEDSFGGNSKYLYLWIVENIPSIRAFWITGSQEVFNELTDRGYRVAKRSSFQGARLQISASVYVYCDWPWDIGVFISKGALLVNLWHGSGLKNLAYGNKTSALHKRPARYDLKLRARILGSTLIADLFIATSPAMALRFSDLFRLPLDRIPVIGSPRLDCAVDDELAAIASKFDDRDKWDPSRSKFREIYVYAPTFRTDKRNFLSEAIKDVGRLNTALRYRDAIMYIKLHPKDAKNAIRDQDRIRPWPRGVDIYSVITEIDCLITDYSSLMFDYIKVSSSGLVLYPFDLAEYSDVRGFYFPYDDSTAGLRVDCFQDVVEVIADGRAVGDLDEEKLARVRDRCWGSSVHPASAVVVDRIRTALRE